MTPEEKELLLKELCGRLPYGLTVQISLYRNDGRKTDIDLDPYVSENIWELIDKYHALPYLRPMSSMTELEKSVLSLCDAFIEPRSIELKIDFYNKQHFDYRGLIEKGLAIKAPEGMYD